MWPLPDNINGCFYKLKDYNEKHEMRLNTNEIIKENYPVKRHSKCKMCKAAAITAHHIAPE